MKKKKTKEHKFVHVSGPRTTIDKNPTKSVVNRILIATPCTGLVRMEWVGARFSQIIPTNWSQADAWQYMSNFVPLAYQLADAENLIAKQVVEGDFEWLLFVESDNLLPPNALRKFNEYMMENKYAVIGGLYFTKSVPPEPMIYRGRGTGYYDKWKFGDKVMCDGLPFGCTLISGALIKEMWKDSPEYQINGQTTRRIFQQPNDMWIDPITGRHMHQIGTTDLQFCTRVMEGNYLARAGYPHLQKLKYPFMVDTTIFVKHIDANGIQWPLDIPLKFDPGDEKLKEIMGQFTGPSK